MDKTLQEMQMEAARYWAGVEEMKNCPWRIAITASGKAFIQGQVNNGCPIQGPYLQIEDGNHWSSAAILARCGKKGPDTVSGFIWTFRNGDESLIDFLEELDSISAKGFDELANNLALQWLHKNAHDVWLKGMELCN